MSKNLEEARTSLGAPAPSSASDFEQAAGEGRKSFLQEYVEFLRAEKKYWMIPIALVLLVLVAIVTLGGTAAAPFIYTLF